jgi:WD40 repeat protein
MLCAVKLTAFAKRLIVIGFVALSGLAIDYISARAEIQLVPLTPHPEKINSVVFSQDGALLLSGGDQTLKLWDARNGRLIRTFNGPSAGVESVDFSPDGRFVVSGDLDHAVRLWDAATGQLLQTFHGHEDQVDTVRFSHDGSKIASGGIDKTIRLWDVESRRALQVFRGHKESVTSVVFSPNDQELVSGSFDWTIKLWNVSTAKLLHSFPSPCGINSLSFLAGDKQIICGTDTGADNSLMITDLKTSKTVKQNLKSDMGVGSLVMTRDASKIIFAQYSYQGNYSSVAILDANAWKITRTLPSASTKIESLAVSPSGDRIVVGGNGPLEMWNVETGQLVRRLGHLGQDIGPFAFWPNGSLAISAKTFRSLVVWDWILGRPLRAFVVSAYPKEVAISSDGTRVLVASENELQLFDLRDGGLLRTFSGHQGVIRSIAISLDNSKVVSADEDHFVRLWDTDTGKAIHGFSFPADSGASCAVALSHDGRRLLCESSRQRTVWDLASARTIGTFVDNSNPHATLSDEAVNSAVWSLDGTHVLSARGNSILLWDVRSGRNIRAFSEHAGTVNSVALSPDGSRFISGSDDKTVKMWDLVSNASVITFHGHLDSVVQVAFSADGQHVLSGSSDRTIKLWDVKGILLATLLTVEGAWQ